MQPENLRDSEALETALRDLPDQTALQDSIHHAHAEDRDRIMAALFSVHAPDTDGWATRMCECADSAFLYLDYATRTVSKHLLRCCHRLCPLCGRIRSAEVSADVLEIVILMKSPRYMVLTKRHTDAPLRDQVDALRADLRRLRSRGFWQSRVLGGVYTLEITRNKETGRWHPHVNIIYDGEYMPQKLLSFQWQQVTGNSRVVWITQVRDRKGAVQELCKYVGKTQHPQELPGRAIVEYARAVAGTRMVQTFGCWHRREVVDEDVQSPLSEGAARVSVAQVLHLATLGSPAALRLVDLVARRWPMFARYVHQAMPQLTPAEEQTPGLSAGLAQARGRSPPARAPPPAADDPDPLETALYYAFRDLELEETDGVLAKLDPNGNHTEWQSSQEQLDRQSQMRSELAERYARTPVPQS